MIHAGKNVEAKEVRIMKATGRQAATLVLEHLEQKPMPIVDADECDHVRIKK